MAKTKDPEAQKRKEEIKKADVRLLAQLGYKQEFKRDFKPIEVCPSAILASTQDSRRDGDTA